jgi:chemotaxis protein histidine kinase CheA
MDINPMEGEFQEEVLRLFALEALEWIRQIKAALLELESAPAPKRTHVIYEMVLRNLTNLKGSAATVELPSIGNLAFMLVPLLQTMQKEQRVSTSDYYGPLRQGLDALSSVIQVLAMAETKALVVADLESITRRQADALQSAVEKARTTTGSPEKPETDTYALDGFKLIAAVLPLKRVEAVGASASRHMAELLMRRIHTLLDAGSGKILAVSLAHALQELHELDERFLEEARQRSAAITAVLGALQSSHPDSPGSQKSMREALREVAFLHASALSVEAAEVVRLLHGLETFFIQILYRGVRVAPERIEAVAIRVLAVVGMAQEWVDMGRKERAEIDKVLVDFGIRVDVKKSTSFTVPH